MADLIIYDDASMFDDFLLERLRSGTPMQSLPRLMRYRLHRGRSDALLETFGENVELPQVHPDRWGQSQATVAWGAGLGPGHSSAFFDRSTAAIAAASGAAADVP